MKSVVLNARLIGGSKYPLIQLEHHELFRNPDKSAGNVEVRSGRSIFKARDIGTLFGMQSLVKSILSEETRYEHGVDYVVIQPSLNQNIDR
ncbi:hypothetical protein V7S43_006461 [Phytophthora oleae]|uniref:Uncharacterized protein n=1 Tax=Phytophthora oleae TaxID=2107226 RepID=A0ABD3FN84_9STRA